MQGYYCTYRVKNTYHLVAAALLRTGITDKIGILAEQFIVIKV